MTHLNYAFANINASTWQIAIGDEYADTQYLYPGQTWDPSSPRGNFGYINTTLKQQNPQLKTLISVGGWTWYDIIDQ
jgi:chitinase